MIFDGKKIVTIESELNYVLYNHYINIVEKPPGKKNTLTFPYKKIVKQ